MPSNNIQLYETLHVGEHQVKKERDMHARLEQINAELLPLEKVSLKFIS